MPCSNTCAVTRTQTASLQQPRTEPVDAGDLDGVGGAATAIMVEHRAPLLGVTDALRILLELILRTQQYCYCVQPVVVLLSSKAGPVRSHVCSTLDVTYGSSCTTCVITGRQHTYTAASSGFGNIDSTLKSAQRHRQHTATTSGPTA